MKSKRVMELMAKGMVPRALQQAMARASEAVKLSVKAGATVEEVRELYKRWGLNPEQGALKDTGLNEPVVVFDRVPDDRIHDPRLVLREMQAISSMAKRGGDGVDLVHDHETIPGVHAAAIAFPCGLTMTIYAPIACESPEEVLDSNEEMGKFALALHDDLHGGRESA